MNAPDETPVAESAAWPSVAPDAVGLDLAELVLEGALPPLHGFLDSAAAQRVRTRRALPDGTPFPVPVTLRVPEHVVPAVSDQGHLVLEDEEGTPVAAVTVEEVWRDEAGETKVAGPVRRLRPLAHGPFRALRLPPDQTRAALRDDRALAVPLRSPLTQRALTELRALADGSPLLLLPLVGDGAPRLLDAAGLVRTTVAAAAGLGALVVPVPVPDMGSDEETLGLATVVAAAHGATAVALPAEVAALVPTDLVPALPVRVLTEGGPQHDAAVLARLHRGESVADAGFPAAAGRELAAAHPPPEHRGVSIFFTGLSGSGKSTVARALHEALLERGGRTVTMLDGDIVRRLLSAGLTFSREDRELNIRRIGWVAAEVARHGGIAICAPIAPYATTRAEVRRMVERAGGGFVLVHVATPLEVCEARDRKGLYAKARAGLVPSFTGVSDPYEAPTDAEIVLDTSTTEVDEAVATVLEWLAERGFLASTSATAALDLGGSTPG